MQKMQVNVESVYSFMDTPSVVNFIILPKYWVILDSVKFRAILPQFDRNDHERIVVYTSCTCSKVEQRYSQTETEALGVVFGRKQIHMYFIGIVFVLDTYWTMALRLKDYFLNEDTAHVLSRQPLSILEKNSITEDYVIFLTDHLMPSLWTDVILKK